VGEGGETAEPMTCGSNPTPSTWESLYVIVGSFCAALMGLQFVVRTLVAESRAVRIESAGSFRNCS
jgi:hypothetical protein